MSEKDREKIFLRLGNCLSFLLKKSRRNYSSACLSPMGAYTIGGGEELAST